MYISIHKGIIEKEIGILEKKGLTKVIREIYCGIHKKNIDDPDLVTFFKFKCWL